MPPTGWARVTGESEHRLVINSLGCQAKETFSPEDPGDSERSVGQGLRDHDGGPPRSGPEMHS